MRNYLIAQKLCRPYCNWSVFLTLKCCSKMAKHELVVTRALKCCKKMVKRELVVARTLKSRISCIQHRPTPHLGSISSRFVSPRSLPQITQDHRAPLVSSNRERFAYYQHISYFLKFLVCIHTGNPSVPPRVLASGPKPCGGNNKKISH